MSVETVARRYAAALADVVANTSDIDSVKTELKTWEQMIGGNGDLQSAFGNPAISQANKEKVLESLIEKIRPTKTTANFLRVLLKNGRLTEIDEINRKFSSVLEERSGAVSAQIISARSLSESEKSEMQTNLTKLTGKNVSLKFEIDETLIGGVITRLGSTVYDGSVKMRLETLKTQLISG